MRLKRVFLKARSSGAAIGRHPWIFRSMLEEEIRGIADGEPVSVYGGPDRRWIAYGLYNSKSEICIRLLSWEETHVIDAAFLSQRFKTAVDLRKKFLNLDVKTNAQRWIHSDADHLSGLVLDVYAGHGLLTVSSNIWIPWLSLIYEILQNSFSLESLLVRTDKNMLEADGLPILEETPWGESPQNPILIQENGLNFSVDLQRGQKTGFFLDQRDNRELVSSIFQGGRALDLCCYSGGFSIYLAKKSGSEVMGVDTSASALELARKNSRDNNLSIEFEESDALSFCQRQEKASFDLVVLDPPKLAPTKKSKVNALRKYYKMNQEALQLVKPGGVFVSCSCSGQIDWEDMDHLLASGARRSGRQFQLLFRRGAAADHPVSLHCPQTEYLKVLIGRIF